MASFCFKPCEICCQACGELCKCVDKGCTCCCQACQKPCDMVYGCCCPSDKPSPIFLTFSGIICGIAIILAVSGMTQGKSGCNSPLTAFLVIALLLNVALVLFAVYLYWQFSKPYGQDPQHPNDANPVARAGQMFCYDPVVFVYMLVLAGALVMAILGAIWLGQADRAKCSSGQRSAVSSVVTCLWIYLLCGIVVIMISLCVECARVKEIQHHQQAAQRPHRVSMMPFGPSGWMRRLFFPRQTVVVQQPYRPPQQAPAAIPPQNVPYATPANQPPPQINTQGPPAPPQQAWGTPTNQQQQQQQGGGSSLADLAAQGLRFGANFLNKHSQQQQQQQQQPQPQQAGRRDLGNAAM